MPVRQTPRCFTHQSVDLMAWSGNSWHDISRGWTLHVMILTTACTTLTEDARTALRSSRLTDTITHRSLSSLPGEYAIYVCGHSHSVLAMVDVQRALRPKNLFLNSHAGSWMHIHPYTIN